MICKKCGNKLEKGIAFCPNCGTKVTANNEATNNIALDNNPIFNTLITLLNNAEIGIFASILVLISLFLPLVSISAYSYSVEFSLFDFFNGISEIKKYINMDEIYTTVFIILLILSIVSLLFAIKKVKPALIIIGILQLAIMKNYFPSGNSEFILRTKMAIGYYLHLVGSILLIFNGLTAFYGAKFTKEKVYYTLSNVFLVFNIFLYLYILFNNYGNPGNLISPLRLFESLIGPVCLIVGMRVKNNRLILLTSILYFVITLFNFRVRAFGLILINSILFTMSILFTIKENIKVVKIINIIFIIFTLLLSFVLFFGYGYLDFSVLGWMFIALWCRASLAQKDLPRQ